MRYKKGYKKAFRPYVVSVTCILVMMLMYRTGTGLRSPHWEGLGGGGIIGNEPGDNSTVDMTKPSNP